MAKFVCLYDKNFKALGRWTTYGTNKWTLEKKAYEFDAFNAETREIDNSIHAMFVGFHDADGSLLYLAFSGKPTTANRTTKIAATDVRQIFNQQVDIDLRDLSINTVKKLYQKLLMIPASFQALGLTYDIDLSELDQSPPVWKEQLIDRESAGVTDLWNLIQAVNMCYDCYVESVPNLKQEKITFKVRRINKVLGVKLGDFNEAKVVNNTAVTNRVICKNTAGTNSVTFYLLSDDTVLDEASAIANYQDQIIYPPRYETQIDDDINKAIAEALKTLYKNRFQAKVTINSDTALGYILKRIDLSYFGDIYGYNSADNSTVKRLPVMSIKTDNTDKVVVTFGRLQEFWY